MKNTLLGLALLAIVTSCATNSNSTENTEDETGEVIEYNNPHAEGFDLEGSDLIATILADKAMHAMGGREAWDNTRFISWNFFGRRTHVWDKWTGDVRIEEPKFDLTILMNINTKEGKVMKAGSIVSDSLDFYLQRGYELWVNDAYWLVMPYKLKDSGVTLKYVREDTTLTGKNADVISLSFKDIGVTPQNIYEVWIDYDSKLVTQWAYFADSTESEPRFITPWADYKKYGEIMLSGDRGRFALTDIQVMKEVPEGTLTEFSMNN